MRIAFVIARGDAFGGSSRHVIDMAARLQEDGHAASVVIGGDPSMVVPQRLAERRVPFTCIPGLGREISPRKDLPALLRVRRAIKRFSPDLVSTHAAKGGFLGRLACFGLRVPVLYTPHCWSFVDGFPGARKYRLIEKWMAKLATRIVAVSEAERQFGLSKSVGREDRTVLVYNGLGEVPEDGMLERPGGDSATTRIVMVGRFEAQKDQPLLLSALAELKDLDWELTLVGDGPKKDECVELAEELGLSGRVEFAGYQSQVEQGLAGHDLFALITNWEGFPRSILEAMRAGLPIIASDVGGCAESVVDGVNGRIVPQGDLAALKQALGQLLADSELRKQMSRRGFELYCEKYSFETMYRSYLRLYGSLLDRRGAKRATVLQPTSTPSS